MEVYFILRGRMIPPSTINPARISGKIGCPVSCMPMVLVVAALATVGLMVIPRVRSSLSRLAVSQA